MGKFDSVSPGTPRGKSPANSASWINSVSKSAEHYETQVAGGQAGSEHAGTPVNPATGKVKNLTEQDLLRGHVVQIGDDLLDDINHRNLWYEGNKPTTDSMDKLGVVRAAIKQDAIGVVQMIGMATAIVDVTDIEHTHAKAVDDDVVAVSATSGPMRIWSKVTETGEQEVSVLLGAPVNPATIIIGQATAAYTAGTSSIEIDSVVVSENGIDPRSVSGDLAEHVPVIKLGGGALKDNDWVVATQMDGGGFEAVIRPGGEGGGNKPSIAVRLTASVASAGPTAAKLIAAYDSDDAGLLPVAVGETISPSNTDGFGSDGLIGQKWKAQWDVVNARYELIHELLDRVRLRGKIKKPDGATGTYILSFSDGTCWLDNLVTVNGRKPLKTDGTYYGSADHIIANNAGQVHGVVGDWVEIEVDMSVGTTEQTQWNTLPLLFHTLKGTVGSDITQATSTFTVSNLTSVHGPGPAGTISITNDPPLDVKSGGAVFLRYNPSISGDRLKSWDTDSTHNHEAILRGYEDYSYAAGVQALINDGGDLKWVGTLVCNVSP